MRHPSSHRAPTRRQFIGTVLGASFALPAALPAWALNHTGTTPLRMGVIADIHKDIMHDADRRLDTFVDAMTVGEVDAILQLGDFCTPKEENKQFLSIFNRFDGPRYHVIGNHETDGGFQRSDAVKFLGMPSRYYSFDLQGFHFIVLDANDAPEGHTAGYPSYIATDQREWITNDLAETESPVFVFVHQSLERETDITEGADVRKILEHAEMPDGTRKVAAVLNGHHHIDHARNINGIPYIHINSASYYWMGGERFKHQSYSEEIHRKYPYIQNTSPYQDSLYTTLTIDPERGRFSLSPSSTDWNGPSPKELGFEREGNVANGCVSPRISGRSIGLPTTTQP
jgi:Icc protein